MLRSNYQNDITEIIRKVANDDDRKLSIEFFILFSRFEYALKRSGFVKGNKKRVDSDWDKFGKRYNRLFLKNNKDDLYIAWDYFCKSPPKKQILDQAVLNWSDEGTGVKDRKPELKWLLVMVRRVRNNLFHGGKFPTQPIDDPSRDRELIQKSMFILFNCLNYDKKVFRYFKEDFI
jgi:hypothetical protein